MRHYVPLILVAGCGPDRAPAGRAATEASLSRAADAQLVAIPAGKYVAGSTPEERAVAYDDYLATAGHDAAREAGWFDREEDRHLAELGAFQIDLMPVTQAAYAEFVAAGGAPAPTMDEETWRAQGYQQVWPDEVVRFVWADDRPPEGRADHPVVLVDHAAATAYCAWRGEIAGAGPRRLPTAAEYEKAARGAEGLTYPWGNAWDRAMLNSEVGGPHDTVPVGSFPDGKSPYGVLDLAGNVFHWTSSPWPLDAGARAAERTVKGSAWEDFAGVGRGASMHGRPPDARHVIVGFRCAADP
jgi:formylglycine-generating enzyme required for sulfatase activity